MKEAKKTFVSWGLMKSKGVALRMQKGDEAPAWGNRKSFLAAGKMRSYGDSAFDSEGGVVGMKGWRKILGFDADKKFITVQAGCTLGEVLEFVVPRGFFLPVVPGTKDITVGGAIANDIHGKNHHGAGSFGHHVASLELLRSVEGVCRCSLGENPEFFCATIGGMGLTGIILSATLRLEPIVSTGLEVSKERFGKLEDFEALCVKADKDYTHTVAWVDALAPLGQLGRGIFMAGRWQSQSAPLKVHSKLAITIPPMPISPLVGPMLKVFNSLYYYRASATEKKSVEQYNGFFFPLDALNEWSRLYGPAGMTQFQCVVPMENFAAIKEMLVRVKKSGQGSFLGVLKKFGNRPNVGMMSFPMSGYTLALDFANRGGVTKKMLGELVEVTREAGGRFYAAKDNGYQPAADFQKGYPMTGEFKRFVDGKFSSDLWRRLSQ